MGNKKAAELKPDKPKPASVKESSLSELIAAVDEHFNRDKPSGVYLYTLGRFQHGWVFNVVENWTRWMSARLKHQFGPHEKPEAAVKEFLDYVKQNRIMVSGLQD